MRYTDFSNYILTLGVHMNLMSMIEPNLISILKLIVAAIVGGVIGLERESVNRPAGFRTHILVCVAAAMIMDINILLMKDYVQGDPTRLGAQVISGMGFLGAGTIIKEGASVKGLTTAASLWAVACLGLAIGSGFFGVAIFAMLIMLITLKTFSVLEERFTRDRRITELNIYTDLPLEKIGVITVILGSYHCKIIHLSIDAIEEGKTNRVNLTYELAHGMKNDDVLKKLNSVEGINRIEKI